MKISALLGRIDTKLWETVQQLEELRRHPDYEGPKFEGMDAVIAGWEDSIAGVRNEIRDVRAALMPNNL